MSLVIAAIDPGETHVGVCVVTRDPEPHQCDCLDHAPGICLNYAYELSPDDAYQWLRRNRWRLQRLVIERFQLYPWMARQQGFSEFRTAECIGVLKYLASESDLPYTLQDAAGCKRKGRQAAKSAGLSMTDRKIGSGKYAYWGPDFTNVASGHARDAAAHGCYYALTPGHA